MVIDGEPSNALPEDYILSLCDLWPLTFWPQISSFIFVLNCTKVVKLVNFQYTRGL